MRQLRKLLTFASRTLVNASASGGVRVPLHLHLPQVPAATAASGWHEHPDGPHIWTPHPFQLVGFASDDGPPHRGQREQSGEVAAHDRQRVAEEDAISEALSGSDPANAAAAAASPDAQSGAQPATDSQAADAAAAVDPEISADLSLVEAELGKLGFEAGGTDEAFEGMDNDGPTSLSDSDDEDALGLSGSDEDEAGERRPKGEGEGVLAEAGRQQTILEEIQSASKKRQKFLLQQQLRGTVSAESLAEDLKPPQTGDFSVKVVDVNRTSKGARAGRVQGYSALVVVGNQKGILGQGSGKALEAKSAVDKATRKALKHLMYVPRFRAHTIHYPLTVLYGKTKLIMYPKASGRGIKASNLMKALCQLAGIQDVGIKIQGSRNLRNSVQALFKAFDQMQTRVDEDSVDSKPYPELPPRYHMAKPVPPQIPGMENFDWDNLIDKVLVEAAPAQLEAEEVQEQQAATG